jgi:hypothetical protein
MTKHKLGFTLGDFFTKKNSSGHPEAEPGRLYSKLLFRRGKKVN